MLSSIYMVFQASLKKKIPTRNYFEIQFDPSLEETVSFFHLGGSIFSGIMQSPCPLFKKMPCDSHVSFDTVCASVFSVSNLHHIIQFTFTLCLNIKFGCIQNKA